MTVTFTKATKASVRLKIAIQGPSGSGKTKGALEVARGIVGPTGRIAVIDTENKSASLYADQYSFDTLDLDPPYTSARYVEALQAAVAAGYDIVIVDSLSHQWAGAGGILSRKEELDARGGNNWANWAPFSREHTEFLAFVLALPIHVVATLRSKQDYVLSENDRGRQVPKKVGLAAVQREGMEYEFSVVFELQMDHKASASKDRTGLFDGRLTNLLDGSASKALLAWMKTDAAQAPVAAPLAPEKPKSYQADPFNNLAPLPTPQKPVATPPAAAPKGTQSPLCPDCGGPMRDERQLKKNSRAPDFRCAGKTKMSCKGVIWPPKEQKTPTPVVAGEGDMPIADIDGSELPF